MRAYADVVGVLVQKTTPTGMKFSPGTGHLLPASAQDGGHSHSLRQMQSDSAAMQAKSVGPMAALDRMVAIP